MLRYAITSGNDAGSWEANVSLARLWAFEGVDYVQLREKQLDAGELVQIARAMVEVFREEDTRTKLLVNARADVAVAAGADGVHLTSRPGELTAEQVRRVFASAGRKEPVVSASCHTLDDVRRAVAGDVDLVLFGPVFEKRDAGRVVVAGVGLEALQKACVAAAGTPVLALGGVTRANTALCMEAGAAGVAGIRLFV
ncbi:MAG TPA: thiamine phosphate synthase [Acidobacteriaceae bacterium]